MAAVAGMPARGQGQGQGQSQSQGAAHPGEAHYRAVCLGCHQPDGNGVPGAFPPLAGSPWVEGDPERTIKIVLHGLRGPLEIDGRRYDLEMPPQGPLLDDQQLADLLTFVRGAWGNAGDPVSAETVAAVRARYPDRLEYWEVRELLKEHPLEGSAESAPGVLRDVRFEVYEGAWNRLPDFDELEPVSTGTVSDPLLSLEVREGSRDCYGIRFTGTLDVPVDGSYKFELASDDGSRLTVGGQVAVDHDGVHGMSAKTGSLRLRAGAQPFVLEYFEREGGDELALSWSGPGFTDVALTKGNPGGREPSGMPIGPDGMVARVYRGFIDGAGPRAIAVGFPGAVNLAWDAADMRLALVWRGPFFDAARHWSNRGSGFQGPANPHFTKLHEGVPLARLAHPLRSEWPDDQRRPPDRLRTSDFVFGGYQLDQNRWPTFHYRFGGAEVSDRIAPAAPPGQNLAATATDTFERTLTITPDPQPQQETLYHRAARGQIEQTGDHAFTLDGALAIAVEPGDSVRAILRQSGEADELVIAVRDTGEPVEVRYTIKQL